MTRARIQATAFFTILLLLILGWFLLLLFHTPSEIVDWLGVTNSYLVAFLLAVFGAVGSVTPFSTYPAIYTMAAGEVNPFILVPLAALGLTAGDYLFILFGISAQSVLSEKFQKKVEKLLRWLLKKSTRFIQVFLFVWVGFLPLANNLITAPLALTKFSPRKMFLPILLGNTTFPTLAALLGAFGPTLS